MVKINKIRIENAPFVTRTVFITFSIPGLLIIIIEALLKLVPKTRTFNSKIPEIIRNEYWHLISSNLSEKMNSIQNNWLIVLFLKETLLPICTLLING